MGFSGTGYKYQSAETGIKQVPLKLVFNLPYQVVSDSNFDKILEEIKSSNVIAVDTETTALDFTAMQVVGVSFCAGKESYYMFIRHSQNSLCLSKTKAKQIHDAIMSRKLIFMFNARFDLRALRKEFGLDFFNMGKVVDVQSLVFLGDTNMKMPNLKMCEEMFLGIKPPTFDEVVGEDILYADPEKLSYYAAMDAFGTYKLGELFYPTMSKLYPFIVNLDEKIIVPMLMFEDQTIDIDYEHFYNLMDSVKERIEVIKSKMYEECGVLNLGSNEQVKQLLVSRGYDTKVKTPKGAMSVGTPALKNLVDVDFVKNIIEYRSLVKAVSSYIEPFIHRMEYKLPVRFHYLLNAVPTYRLAAGSFSKKLKGQGFFMDMNIMAIPKPHSKVRKLILDKKNLTFFFEDSLQEGSFFPKEMTEHWVETGDSKLNVRKGFIAPEGFVWLAVDYSGQEVRVAANLSQEPVWMQAFLTGEDPHKQTAIAVWGKENYNKDYRKMAKILNFSQMYGGNKFTISEKLKVPLSEAEQIEIKFKKALPTFFCWVEDTHTQARRQGFVVNPYGLPRRVGYYYQQGSKWVGFADRTSVNTKIQSSGAIMIRITLVKLLGLINGKYKGDVFFRATVHDEVDLIVRKSRLLEFCKELKDIMTKVTPSTWKVPMDVEFTIGNSWGEGWVMIPNADFTDFSIKEEPAPEVTEEEIKPFILDEEDEAMEDILV